MVHLGPLTPWEPDEQDGTEGWTLDHQVHAIAQTESRPGTLTDEGERWMDRQHTGKVTVVCTCGYSSGLIDHTELARTVAALVEEHAPLQEGDVPIPTPFGPMDTVADWLRANGIDPRDVPIDGPITIEREYTEGPWYIRYAAMLRKDGRPYLDEATSGPAQELRTVPLRVEPPENMQVRRI